MEVNRVMNAYIRQHAGHGPPTPAVPAVALGAQPGAGTQAPPKVKPTMNAWLRAQGRSKSWTR